MSSSIFVSRAVALGLLLGGLLGALPAAATPVSVYADGTADFGFDPADVAAAIAAGANDPTSVGTLGSGSPWLTITTPNGISGVKGKNKENPTTGSSIWTLHIAANAPTSALDDFALVITGHDPNDPIKKYKSENVGLEIDTELPWLFVTPGGSLSAAGTTGGTGSPIYIAFLLGDLEPGGDYEIPIEYLLGQKPKKAKNASGEKVFTFPRYTYAVVSITGVPEPSTFALLGVGALALGLAARRAR
jgi:hypothetical protein